MTRRLHRMRHRLTYANVTATLALFVALGGTSYAAATLARNSVGKSQIRSGAVRSDEIRNGTIKLRDIAGDARAGLRGQPGPAGPPGASAISEFVRVNSGGGASGSTTAVSHQGGTGLYTVDFANGSPTPRDVSGCAYAATLARVPGGTVVEPPAGRITVASAGGPTVLVRTYDAAGNVADAPFHLIVAC